MERIPEWMMETVFKREVVKETAWHRFKRWWYRNEPLRYLVAGTLTVLLWAGTLLLTVWLSKQIWP